MNDAFRRLLLAGALNFSPLLAAADLDCLVRFASVPEAAVDYPLIETTYDQLLDTLGGKLGEANLQKILQPAGGVVDPLHLPDNLEGDQLALARALKSFEDLLIKKAWNKPEVRARLVARMRRRLPRKEENERRAETIRNTVGDLVIPFTRHHGRHIVSPDGRYLVFSDCDFDASPGSSWDLVVVDLQTRETKRHTYPRNIHHGPPAFTSDGTRLVFPLHPDGAAVLPFAKGQPDWANRTEFHPPNGIENMAMSGVLPTADPDVLYAEGVRNIPIRIDLKTKQTSLLQIRSLMEGTDSVENDGWRIIPGTADVALKIRGGPNRNLVRYDVLTVTPDGAVTLKKRYDRHDMNDSGFIQPLSFKPDGTFGLYHQGGKIFETGGTQVLDPEMISPGPEWQAKIGSTTLRPGHPDQLLMAFVLPGPATHQWRVYDLKEKKVLFSYELPYPEFSGDGKVLVSHHNGLGPKATLKVHNVERLEREYQP